MFQITDEYLEQAGFTGLENEQKESVRSQVEERVQNKIGDAITAIAGEGPSDELVKLMDGDKEVRLATLNAAGEYRQTADYQALEQLGNANGASDDEIASEYAVFAWMTQHGVNIGEVVQNAMNETMADLQMITQSARDAVDRMAE